MNLVRKDVVSRYFVILLDILLAPAVNLQFAVPKFHLIKRLMGGIKLY